MSPPITEDQRTIQGFVVRALLCAIDMLERKIFCKYNEKIIRYK